MPNLDVLSAQVKATNGVKLSTHTLVNGIAEALKKAGTDQAKLADLQKALQTRADELAENVAANPKP